MAPVRWSNLPSEILLSIFNLLNSDVDRLRLRSICPSWRSSLPPHKPISFPLKLPPLPIPPDSPFEPGILLEVTLHQITFYRLSPPASGPRAGDSSSGWLFKVLETKANTFSLLTTLTTQKMPGTILNRLNLLDYRISEIYKSYAIDSVDFNLDCHIRRVIGLWNYIPECEFAALVLRDDGGLSYWKLGARDWTPIDTNGYEFDDVILCNGMCYAIDEKGILISFDSKMNPTVVVSTKLNLSGITQNCNYLVESESDLFVVSEINPDTLHFNYEYIGKRAIDLKTLIEVDYFGLLVNKLDKCNGKWCQVRGFGDKAFLLCEDASLSIRAKDFGCTKNCVYLSDWCFVDDRCLGEKVWFYRMGGRREVILTRVKNCYEICLPPPSWVYD